MEANLAAAIELLGRGMVGIFTVLIIIALTVALLGRLDSNKQG